MAFGSNYFGQGYFGQGYAGSSGTTTNQTQTGITRITAQTTKTQTGKAAILQSVLHTQTGVSRISVITQKTQTGITSINSNVLGVQVGTVAYSNTNDASSASVSVTVGGVNPGVLVMVSTLDSTGSSGGTPTAITLNGASATHSTVKQTTTQFAGAYYFASPSAGTLTVSATFGISLDNIKLTAIPLTGCASGDATDGSGFWNATGANPSDSVTTASNYTTLFDVINTAATSITPAAGQTQLENNSTNPTGIYVSQGVSSKVVTAAGSASMGWTAASSQYAYVIVGIKQSITTQLRTQTGVTRIKVTQTKTQTGKADIAAITIKTQTGVTRIQATTTKTQTGKADILQSGVAKTQTGITRITATTTKPQTGVARILQIVSRLQTGVSNIYNPANPSTQRTQTGKADIAKANVARTQTGVTRIMTTVTKTQTGVARVMITTPQTQTGKTNIRVVTIKVQSGKMRISGTTTQTQTGVMKIALPVSARSLYTDKSIGQATWTTPDPGNPTSYQ